MILWNKNPWKKIRDWGSASHDEKQMQDREQRRPAAISTRAPLEVQLRAAPVAALHVVPAGRARRRPCLHWKTPKIHFSACSAFLMKFPTCNVNRSQLDNICLFIHFKDWSCVPLPLPLRIFLYLLILLTKQNSPLRIHRIFVPVFIRNHCGIGPGGRRVFQSFSITIAHL